MVKTSDGIVLIDRSQKPTDIMRLKAEIESLGPLRYILNTEPHGDHWASNGFFDAPVVALPRSSRPWEQVCCCMDPCTRSSIDSHQQTINNGMSFIE